MLIEVNRDIATQGIMWSECVVLDHVCINSLAQVLWRIVLVDINVIVFQCPEEAFGPDIIQSLSSAIHRDPDFVAFKELNVIWICEMATLVTVDNFRFSLAQSSFQTGHHKSLFQRARQLIVNNASAVPINDHKQVHESFAHLDIGYIDSPDLIRMRDCEVSEQIRANILSVITLAEIGFWVDRQDSHLAHQALNRLLVDQCFPSQDVGDLAITKGRMISVNCVDPVHHLDGLISHSLDLRFIVDTGSID